MSLLPCWSRTIRRRFSPAVAAIFLMTLAHEAVAAPLCAGGQVIFSDGSMVGCLFRLPEQGSHCEKDVFCDPGGCREIDDPFSVVMCQCDLADASCGVGECVGDAYCEGAGCDFPVCY